MRLGPSGPCIQCQCLSVSMRDLFPLVCMIQLRVLQFVREMQQIGGGGGVGGLSTTVSSTIKTCHHVITEMLLTMAIHAHNTFNIRLAIRNKYMSQN